MTVPMQWTIPRLVEAFGQHLRDVRGAKSETCESYTRHAREFLETTFAGARLHPGAIAPGDVVRFIEAKSQRWRSDSVAVVATALRAFFRFLGVAGLGDPRLCDAVPSVAGWRLATLPSFLDDAQWARLHASLSRSTRGGLRDRAIVLCLSGLGLRATEVTGLHLEDIDWRAGVVHIRTRKTRHGDALPLPRGVGRAIAAYLRDGRPVVSHRLLFVEARTGAPLGRRGVRNVARTALRRAGITGLASTGARALRHTLATRMIRRGASLKEIADVLGHRSLESTMIYAKVDLPSLAAVALPWPEVLP